MPIHETVINGVTYYHWGKHGKKYRSRKKAAEQQKAIYASGYTKKEDESLDESIAQD